MSYSTAWWEQTVGIAADIDFAVKPAVNGFDHEEKWLSDNNFLSA
jgi:hypothetical protein